RAYFKQLTLLLDGRQATMKRLLILSAILLGLVGCVAPNTTKMCGASIVEVNTPGGFGLGGVVVANKYGKEMRLNYAAGAHAYDGSDSLCITYDANKNIMEIYEEETN